MLDEVWKTISIVVSLAWLWKAFGAGIALTPGGVAGFAWFELACMAVFAAAAVSALQHLTRPLLVLFAALACIAATLFAGVSFAMFQWGDAQRSQAVAQRVLAVYDRIAATIH